MLDMPPNQSMLISTQPTDTPSHASYESLPPIQDANLLREAALKSRRTRKQTSVATPGQGALLEPGGSRVEDGDTPMNDVSQPKADTEDGEILESDLASKNKTPEANLRDKTSHPPFDDNNDERHVTAPIASTGEIGYVRPGLKMTSRDLHEAKCLILDLLGLGVKPEYLVDCGVSPQCLAVCFYEMNLRFPLNLDRRQIHLPPFYDLEKHMKDSQRREQIIRQRDRTKLASVPQGVPRSLPSIDGSSVSDGDSLHDPSKPAEETQLYHTTRIVSESTTPASPKSNCDQLIGSTSSSSQHSGNALSDRSTPTVDLPVTEDQKQMELLARKAAMESIKRKRATKTGAQPAPLELQDVDSAVDALLASVRMDSASSEPLPEGGDRGHSISSGGEPLPDYDSDAMVEDELGASTPSQSDLGADDQEPNLLLGRERDHSPEHINPDNHFSSNINARVRFDAPARSSSLPLPAAPVTVPVVARRSRPIASDFIDQTPPRPASTLPSDPDRSAPLKRKRSFVDPSVWPRRLVIDLDSSDEEETEDDQAETKTRPTVTSSGKPIADRVPNRNAVQDNHAAQMLLEKELQIKAMMQRIKMRELQKKKSASGTVTPASSQVQDDAKSQTSNATLTPTVASAASSSGDATPVVTPKSEVPLELGSDVPAGKIPGSLKGSVPDSSLGTTSHEMQKKSGGAACQKESTGNSQEFPTNPAAVTRTRTQPQATLPMSSESDGPTPTYFKAYSSPLTGLTSPSLQPLGPSDQQLSKIYWISSKASPQDVNRRLCQYEFPSGVCRDQDCKDIHMRDFGASDDEIWRTASTMFPNAGPTGLNEIVTRVRQSIRLQS